MGAAGSAGAGPQPALERVQAFVNTYDVEEVTDELDSPAALAAWFTAHDPEAEVSAANERDLRTAVELREALRDLMLANAGHGDGEAGRHTLDDIAQRLPLVTRFEADGSVRLQPVEKGGAVCGLARIVAAVAEAMEQGAWTRLKACAADTCQWAYYDTSKNRSRQWCSMRVCGNREKVRAYRERRSVPAAS